MTVWRYKHANFEKASRLNESLDNTSILDPNDIDYSWEKWRFEFLCIMEVSKVTLPNRSNIPCLTIKSSSFDLETKVSLQIAWKPGKLVHEVKYKKIRNTKVPKLKR